MDKTKDRLVEYLKIYRQHCDALNRLNVMAFNQPYRTYFQDFAKSMAIQEVIILAAMGAQTPPAEMFMTGYERQSEVSNRLPYEELGARVPIPSFLEQYSSDTDYQEDESSV